MRQNRRMVSKIVEELTAYLLSAGATGISIDIQDRPLEYVIFLRSDYPGDQDQKVSELTKNLKVPRQDEIIGYYGELIGGSDVGEGGLLLVGMMVDRAEVVRKGLSIEITLYRVK